MKQKNQTLTKTYPNKYIFQLNTYKYFWFSQFTLFIKLNTIQSLTTRDYFALRWYRYRIGNGQASDYNPYQYEQRRCGHNYEER